MLSFIVQSIRMSAAFLFGSTGETITEKAGHLNLGIPGTMCMGAAGGGLGVFVYLNMIHGGAINPFLVIMFSIVFAVLFAGLMGLIYSFLAVTLRANQNITGLALTTFGIGFATFLNTLIPTARFTEASKSFYNLFTFYPKLGWFGSLFLSYGIFVYLAIAIALITSYIFKKTRVGLHLRAIGESPATADAAGINVTRYKYWATIIGSAIAGLGGLFYFMDMNGGNWPYTGPIESLGWLSIAIVIFTMWKPDLSIIGAIVFGALYRMPEAFGVQMQVKELVKMLPYLVTVIVLIITSIVGKKETQPPASLGLSYFREDR